METVIAIKDLTKDYEVGFWKKKKIRALDGLTLEVGRGQIFGFLGGNGAGKTTTIKILTRLLFPTSGLAKILGKDISDVGMHQSIGYCPENPYFYDYLTARELLMYFAELFGFNKAESRSRTEELLGKVGLEKKDWDKQLRKFSKGMLQRTGLAQSLVNDPEIVFLDEPMSGLDPMGRREIRELIAELRDKGKTVFMSTHILSDIEALCDEVAILRQGKLAATGKLSDLLYQSSESRHFEININGISADELNKALNSLSGTNIAAKASGATIQVANEGDVEKVLQIIGKTSGQLVSVQPVKQSLEELFVEKTV